MSSLTEKLTAALSDVEYREAAFEIAGDTVMLCSKPVTGADIESICRKHKTFMDNPTPEAMIDLIIRKARLNEDRTQKAFDLKDKPLLLRMELNQVGDLFGDLFDMGENGDVDLSDDAVEQAEKN